MTLLIRYEILNSQLPKNNIEAGDLVKLKLEWLRAISSKESGWQLQPCLGIVTSVRIAAGMPESKQYAKVLWENNKHMEHYLRDLVKVK